MLVTVLRILTLFLLILGAGCTADKGVKGYVGNDGSSSSDGSTRPSNAVIMLPSTPQVSLSEGSSAKLLILFNRALPRAVTLNWQIQNGENDFDVSAGVISAPEEAESVEIDLKVKNDGLYEGEEKFFLQVSGDTNIFLSSLMYPVNIQENGSPLLISVFGPGTPGSKIQQLNEDDASGGTDIFVRLSSPAGFTVQTNFSVTGNASAGNDYNLSESGSVTFAPGETTKKIRFNLLNDILNESPESFILTLASVPVGTLAAIDNDNKVHTINIVDDDMGSRFEILGVTGGTDSSVDTFLTNGVVPAVQWSNALDEQEYRITIKNSSASDVCLNVVVPTDVVTKSFTPSDCASYVFLQGEEYTVHAEVKVSGVYYPASNSGVFKFIVDGTPPGAFDVLGVFGGSDIEPDQYLAGTLNPSVSWQNAVGEVGYRVAIYAKDSGAEVCAPVSVPANVTSISFQGCTLVRGSWYKATVEAFDSANNKRPAGNNNFEFFVTEVASGFVITGLTGGTADVTEDTNLNDAGEVGDPYAFSVNWGAAGGVDRYEVTILNSNNSVKCPTITVTTNKAKISACRLDLNYNYKVRVVGFDINNVQYPATNSPLPFIFKKGLFLSGDATVPSYYRGIPLTNCGGGATCNATNPYVVTTAFQEEQIVVGKDAVMTAPAWVSGPVATGNGVLEITADIIRVEDSGRITMDGRGAAGSIGAGKGIDGAVYGTGGAYGGNGTRDSLQAAGKAYGSAKNPLSIGSGGGAGGVTAGGSGGGVVKIVVNNELIFKVGTISSAGSAGAVQSGGGSGGSIHLTAKKISGIGGAFSVKGGAGAGANGGPGSGGRAAIYYEEMAHAGGLSGLAINLTPGASGGASGTLFTKNTKASGGDPRGYLTIDLGGTYKHVAGVETPLPLLDPAETPTPTSHLFDAIYSKGEATYIVEATKSYTLQSTASPPTLDYRVVAEGDFLVATGTSLKIASGGYLEWRKSTPINMFTDLIVGGGGVLAHTENRSVKLYSLDVQVNNLTVQGTISANGKGFQAASGEAGGIGAGVEGAGYGGQGGFYADVGQRGDANGKIQQPDSLGSGSAVAPGGGAIKITVTNDFNLSGTVTANGTDGCGGGSGGSIWIQTKNLSGSVGTVSSQGGGSYSGNCGGGGGGRIALYYDSATYAGGIGAVNFIVAGGDSLVDGAAGTIFHKKTLAPSADVNGHLMVLNSTRNYVEDVVTPLYLDNGEQLDSITTDARGTVMVSSQFAATKYTLPSDQITYRLVAQGDFLLPSGSHLQVLDGGYFEVRRNTPYTFDKLTVSQNGFVTHSTNKDAVKRYLLHFILNDLNLAGVIDVSGHGYPAAIGPGASLLDGYGAGHGGYGGNGGIYNTVTGGAPYQENRIKDPDDFGSGTSTHSSYPAEALGVAGGGLVHLEIANDFILSGQIIADGRNGICNSTQSSCSGGASGGSINIVTKNVKGVNGTLSANGGSSGPSNFSGSGGRIALVYEDDSQYLEGTVRNLVNYEKIRAFGGTSYSIRAGAAGSIFLRDSNNPANTNGDLIYNNSNNPHPQKVETLAPQVTYDSITTLNNATLLVPTGQNFTLPTNLDYRIAVEGTAGFPANFTVKNKGYLEWRNAAQISTTNLTIEAGGVLTHSRNYTSAYNPEATNKDYRLDLDITNNFTLNGGGVVEVSERGFQASNGTGTGASAAYGGKSGSGSSPYGSYSNPNNQGSGGGSGPGGGVARIKVGGTTLLNGSILANGGVSGSGGTIKLETGTLSGVTGSLRANGGDGGASGGRISILYTTDSYPLSYLTMTAYGGDGTPDGAAGTIFYKQSAATYGNLIVNNAGRTYDPNVTTVLPQDQLDSVTVDPNSGVEIKAGETVRLPNASVGYKLTVAGTLQLPTNTNTLIVENGGVLELKKNTTFGSKTAGLGDVRNIIVKPQGVIRHPVEPGVNSLAPTYTVNLALDNLTVQGQIDADSRGPFWGTGGVSGGSEGASHAGRGSGSSITGATDYYEPFETRIYGSIKDPVAAGSGVSSTSRGGGVIIIDTNVLDISGRISAVGMSGGGYYSGSGGSVNVRAVEVRNSGGVISARGGNGYSACGGGGRIALRCTGTVGQCSDVSSVTLSAEGGVYGALSAGAGTIFVQSATDTLGRLILNNGNNPYKSGAEAVINETATFDSIVVGSPTTGIYIPAGVVAEFSISDVSFPLRLRGDAKFPGATASAVFNPATEHWGDVKVLEGGFIEFHRPQNFNISYPIVDKPFIYRDFVMEPGARVSHVGNTVHTVHKDNAVYIRTKNLLHIKPDAVINVSGLGYSGDYGLGAGQAMAGSQALGPPVNMTVTFPSYYVGSGGSYGGQGGGLIRYNNMSAQPVVGHVPPARTTYGDPIDPRLPGSGGGNGNSTYLSYSNGGGLVILESEGQFILEGQILANGRDSSYSMAGYGWGGGSGGAVNILANTFTGSYANIQARGGAGGAPESEFGGGGGGGGRVSVRRTVDTYNGVLSVDVSGGAAFDDTGRTRYFIEASPTTRKGADGTYYVSP